MSRLFQFAYSLSAYCKPTTAVFSVLPVVDPSTPLSSINPYSNVDIVGLQPYHFTLTIWCSHNPIHSFSAPVYRTLTYMHSFPHSPALRQYDVVTILLCVLERVCVTNHPFFSGGSSERLFSVNVGDKPRLALIS